MKNAKNEWIRKLLAIALALTVAVTFVPLLGNSVYADDEEPLADENGNLIDMTFDEPVPFEDAEEAAPQEEIDQEAQDPAVDEGAADVEEPDEAVTEDPVPGEEEPIPVEGVMPETLDISALSAMADEMNAAGEGQDSYFETFTMTNYNWYGGVYTFYANLNKAAANNTRIYRLSVDGSTYKNYSGKVRSINEAMNISGLSPGVHTLTVEYYYSGTAYYREFYFPVSIYDRPTMAGTFEAYHNYISYMVPADPNLAFNYLYLDYSKDGVNWQTFGPVSYSANITGLYSNTNYSIRVYYAKIVTYNGTNYLLKGTDTGSTLYAGTFRTGKGSKPAIKSIKVKAYKVKKKKQRVYGYYTGLYLGKRTYYKYKLKIIVKLKKKPGTNGIWINGKKFKGNKKKYVVKLGTMTSYSKPKGKKYPILMYTYFSNAYGGYSPLYMKNKKIK